MMSPTGAPHGIVHTRIAGNLWSQGDQKSLGTTYVETGLIMKREPDTVLGPDAMFYPKGREIKLSPEGWCETMPALVVEIRSKNDTSCELADKAELYLNAGVEMVWIADPRRKLVTEYRRGGSPIDRQIAEALTAEPIIPGFRLPLIELFL